MKAKYSPHFYSLLAASLLFPLSASAQVRNLKGLVREIRDIIDLIIPLLIALAVLFFLFGVFKYFFLKSDDTNREEGRQFILWGIIALFVMVSFWGFVNILANSIFGVGSEDLERQENCFTDPSLCDRL